MTELKRQATGTFEVNLQPLEGYASGEDGVLLGRMSIDKEFAGDLAATSQGEMLMARTPVEGSAGYTAVEQVRGALHGREGGFVLQHYGIMADGEQRLILEIVPGSGTGELTGISGSMTIDAEDDLHCYILTYALAEKKQAG